MRTLITLILISLSLNVLAQTGEVTKEELNKWKDMAKEYKKEPLKLRDKVEGYERSIEELAEEVNRLKAEKESLEEENQQMHMDVADLHGQVADLEKELAEIDYVEEPSPENPLSEDLLFFVQIGAYEFFNINHYFEGVKCMNVQLNEGLNKYVVGSFSDVTKAESFRDDVVKLGIDDAWIVSMLNGERIPMKDALQLLEEMGTLSEEQLNQLRTLYAEQLELEETN